MLIIMACHYNKHTYLLTIHPTYACSIESQSYLCYRYNAAAVITKEKNISVPYLDKFAVSLAKQVCIIC